jgi:hypothetical protein
MGPLEDAERWFDEELKADLAQLAVGQLHGW